jgi:hypothetical protein
MGMHIGSFGSRLTREQRVPDAVWTKVIFDKVDWDTGGGFDVATGGFVVGQKAKFSLSAGVRLLAPDVPSRYVELMLCRSGKPIDMLTREGPFRSPDSVVLDSRATPWAEYERGITRGEIIAFPGDVLEIYVRHSFGEPAHLTMRHVCATGKDTPGYRHPIYFMGLWHV